ncbi:MAG TPA: ABC transporter permease [Candidatus Acidoferrum sp.]|nr:ABC transporter permease [Candidatus Acidoferrum sp.]
MHTLIQDVRYAFRMLVKSPAFTVLAVLTLALGIGATAAIFGVVNGFLLRPLPGKDNANLLVIAIRHPGNEDPHGPSFLDFQDFRAGSDAFSEMAAYNLDFVGVRAEGQSDRVFANYITSNFFATLGLKPAMGTFIFPGESDKSSAIPVAILSYPYWQRRFAGDPGIVGKTITVNGKACTVIGISPKGFFGPYTPAEIGVFLPIGLSDADVLENRGRHGLHVLARPRDGVSRSQARESLQLIAGRLSTAYPVTNLGTRVDIIPERMARPEPGASTNMPLIVSVFLAMSGLVLLVTCANVANLLLVRGAGRGKELAIRAAMGAGRMRLIFQLLTESLILAAIGGITGALFGSWLSHLAGRLRLPGDIPLHMDFSFDWRVFFVIGAIVIFTGVLAGLGPAIRVSRADLNETLREGGRSDSAGAGRSRLRGALVVAQVAGSCLVLIVAGLFLRSLQTAEHSDLGFRSSGILLASMDLSQLGYDETRGTSFYRDVAARARALPGVESASLAFSVPMGNDSLSDRVWKEGDQTAELARVPNISFNIVDQDYFRTLDIPILRGRGFDSQDTKASVPVAVINETMAKQLWPGQDPLGHHFRTKKPDAPQVLIVGVARNSRYESLFEDPQAYFYVPETQSYSARRVIQVRTDLPQASISPEIERIVRNLDPDLPVYDVMPMSESLNGGNGFFLLRGGAIFAGVLGGLSLILAVIGVYGVLSYVTGQRTHEVGIRMALGAQRTQILALMLRQGLLLVGIGLAIGLAMSFGVTRFLGSLLFQIGSFDPITVGGICLLLASVAAIASYLPSRRATTVDPLIALRHE